MCVHKCPRSLHKYNINLHPQFKHPVQLNMKGKLKKKRNKCRITRKLKRMAWIKREKKKSKKMWMIKRFKLQDYLTQESIKQFKEITSST
jgi:hypothetical protein